MYSTVRHKNTCSGFKKINTFLLSYSPKNTRRTVGTPLSFQRVKQQHVYYRGVGSGLGWDMMVGRRWEGGTGWHDSSPTTNCAGCTQHNQPVRQLFHMRSLRTFLFHLFIQTGCWNHSVGRRFLFSGAYCKSDLIVWGTTGLLLCKAAVLEVPLDITWWTFATLSLYPHNGEKVWKNQVFQFVSLSTTRSYWE